MHLIREEFQTRLVRIGCPPLPSKIIYPSSAADIRRVYCEGRFSVAKNIPIPTITCKDDHSYILPSEMIRHMLAHGIDVDVTADRPSSGLFATSEGRAAVNKINSDSNDEVPTKLVIWISGWSDDFEPNSTIVNRGSIWAFTLTVSPPTNSRTKSHNSAVIALAGKSADHRVVIKAIMDDVRKCQGNTQRMYIGGNVKRIIPVRLWLAGLVQDTPARREFVELAGGKGLFSTIFGVSLNVSSVKGLLPSCERCISSRRSCTFISGTCADCADWNVLSPLLKFDPPKNYPTGQYTDTELIGDKLCLSPIDLKFSYLKQESRRCCIYGISGVWRLSEVKTYFQRLQFCDKLVQRFVRYIEVGVSMVENHENVDQEMNSQSLCNLLLQEPSILDDKPFALPFPPRWDNPHDEIREAHVVTVMHLLGLNHGRSMLERIFECMKKRRKFSLFVKNDGVLNTVIDWKLHWCPMLSVHNGSLGGFLSLNFMASNRLLVWLSSCFSQLFDEDDDSSTSIVHPPNKRGHLWDKATCEKWLKDRGLFGEDRSITRVQQLREDICTYT